MSAPNGKHLAMDHKVGALALTATGIGATIGAGIFVVTGLVAATTAGPAVVLSFALAALGCGITGLCYAELSTITVSEGGAYAFAQASWGRLAGWLTGWTLVLQYGVGAATVSVGWSATLNSLLPAWGISLPDFLSSPAGTVLKTGGKALLNAPAMFILIALSAVVASGIRLSSNANGLLVIVKVGVICAFICLGLPHVHPHNWVPFVPSNSGTVGSFGWTGVLKGAAICYFAYIGFDAVPTLSRAARVPKRDVPLGILGSLLVCTILYIAAALVLTGTVPFRNLNGADAFAVALRASGHESAARYIGFAILIALTSVILILLLALPRVLRSMAENGLAPSFFQGARRSASNPPKPTMMFGLMAGLAAGIFPIEFLSESVTFATLAIFLVVCLSVIERRRRLPDEPRRFRVPAVPIVPVLGCVFATAELALLSRATWIYFGLWTVIGGIIYLLFFRNSLRSPAD